MTDLEQMVCPIFEEIDVEVRERGIHPCHYLKKDKDRHFRKDNLQIIKNKNERKCLNVSLVDIKQGIKILVNESLFPYYESIWKKCKKRR